MGSSSCTGSGSGFGSGSPCGACKFLRRKCASDCVFAPYFSNENGPARFAAIHKVFGASNASKLLLHVPQEDRCEAVVTIAYEAQARICDPVYGCVAHIFALQQQVASLQAQLMQAKAQLAHGMVAGSRSSSSSSSSIMENPCDPHLLHSYMNLNMNMNMNMNANMNLQTGESMSPQSSLDCAEEDDHITSQVWSKRRPHTANEQGELHALASRMMRNY